MNTEAVESLLGDKFEIGGEGSAAAGPVGRSASASNRPKTQRSRFFLTRAAKARSPDWN
jgi:lipid-binding SYLF domain-containing protein